MYSYNRGAIAKAACANLQPKDCDKHPNCQSVKSFVNKKGKTVAARCGNKASPGSLKRKSAQVKRAMSPTQLARLERVKAIMRETGMKLGAASHEEKVRRAGKQIGGGCRINARTTRCKQNKKMEDDDSCFLKGKRCSYKPGVKQYLSKRVSPKQLAALRKAREVRSAKARAKKAVAPSKAAKYARAKLAGKKLSPKVRALVEKNTGLQWGGW